MEQDHNTHNYKIQETTGPHRSFSIEYRDLILNGTDRAPNTVNSELLENYRPLSTLPIFGKIFEKVIYDRLYNYFVSQGALYDQQFGFCKNHSKMFLLTILKQQSVMELLETMSLKFLLI